MSEDCLLCQVCQKALCDGDEVIRALEGKIYDTPQSISLDIKIEMWFHSSCFHQWKKVLDAPKELEGFEELGVKILEDGTIAQFFRKTKEE